MHVERGVLRHEIGLATSSYLDEPLAGEGAACQLVRHALHVQDADQIIELAVVHGQPRMRRLPQLIENVLPVLPDIDA